MDMFRNPKPAAAVYSSQAEGRVVLEVCGTLDKGDWPASELKEFWVFTNAERIRLFRNGVFLREFLPDRNRFPNLPHPPVCVDDFAGPELMEREGLSNEATELLHQLWASEKRGWDTMSLLRTLKRKYGVSRELSDQLKYKYRNPISGGPSYRFEAVKRDQVVAQVILEPVRSVFLRVTVERTVLHEDKMWDAVEIRILAVDQNGNRLAYASDALRIKTEGPIALIGPDCIPLRGGSAGFWIRTIGETGTAIVRITGFGPPVDAEFSVE